MVKKVGSKAKFVTFSSFRKGGRKERNMEGTKEGKEERKEGRHERKDRRNRGKIKRKVGMPVTKVGRKEEWKE